MHHGRESVAVAVKTIRNTGALEDLWSGEGTRDEVVGRLRHWSSEAPGGTPALQVVDLVERLPGPPDDGPWLTDVGVTVGPCWVWVTSSDGASHAS